MAARAWRWTAERAASLATAAAVAKITGVAHASRFREAAVRVRATAQAAAACQGQPTQQAASPEGSLPGRRRSQGAGAAAHADVGRGGVPPGVLEIEVSDPGWLRGSAPLTGDFFVCVHGI
jgi:hypothetical protein